MDNDDGCRRFIMVNAVSEHDTSTISEEIDVPILCLDDDEDDDELKIDEGYKLFLEHLSDDDNNLFPLFEDDNGESETRYLKRSKLGVTEEPINNRVSQQRQRQTIGFDESEVSREFPLATTRESIQRDNRVAERRKRKIAELEAARVSRAAPFQRDNEASKVSESKVETLWDVPLVKNLQVIKRDNEARRLLESKVETLCDVPLVKRDNETRRLSGSTVYTSRGVPLFRAKEVTQRDSKAMNMSASKVDTLWDVPLVSAQEIIQRDNMKMSESNVDTLWDVPLVKTKEVIRRDNRMSERRKKKIDEINTAGTSRTEPKTVDETSRFVPVTQNREVLVGTWNSRGSPVKLVNRVTEPKAVDETSRSVPVTQSNRAVLVGDKNKEESVAVVDKDYMSYLTWLVDSYKDSTTEPDPPDIHPPTVPEKNPLPKVKVELDLESCSDDDIIEISDSPFLDCESTPFVVSKTKNVIDLEKDCTEDDTSSCVFTKELMDVLEKPYDEGELLMLSRQVSMKKRVTRCRELRKGRESFYETSELGQSYLEKVSDFDKEYKLVGGDGKARLKLLRGFFFYLENITHAGAFKPWLPENQKRLGLKRPCLPSLATIRRW